MDVLQAKFQNPDWWIHEILTNLYFTCRCILTTLEDPTPGYKDLYRPTHRDVCRFIETYALPGHKVIILMPRGWVKSYIITVGWTIQRILKNLVIGKRDHWIISNATLPNAKEFLKKIKFNFAYNELLRGLFREHIPDNLDNEAERWTLDDIEIKGNSIDVGSVEGNLVSRHYRGMINDDLVNLENSKTVDQIIKVVDWWKLAQSLLEADGLEIILGTRWSFNDLYGHILDRFLQIPKEKEEEFRNQPRIEWHRGRYHYLRYLCWADPVNERGSTFPTLFPESRLKEIQEEQGEYFPGQYLNDPLSFSDAQFKREWFRSWNHVSIPPVKITYQLLDPAGQETKQADYTGHVVLDACSDRNLYLRMAKRRKVSDSAAVEWMIETACFYQSQMIGVEENKFDIYQTLAEFLITQMIHMGKIAESDREYARSIPGMMIKLRHRNRPKPLRIQNLTGWFEQGKILLAPEGMDDLIWELMRFKKTERDDIADALAYILDIVIFPQVSDPPKLLVLPDHLKMTPEERERAEWEKVSEESWAGQGQMVEDFEHLY